MSYPIQCSIEVGNITIGDLNALAKDKSIPSEAVIAQDSDNWGITIKWEM